MGSNASSSSSSALLLCGGGSRGAMEVGFYQALWELGLRIDFIVGSSIGALNGAFIAAGVPPSELARLWTGFRRRDGVRFNMRGLLKPRRRPGLFCLDPLRKLLRQSLPVTRLEDLCIPLTIVTTDLQQGKPVYWHGRGDLIEPLLASLSLPILFPPVEIQGRQFVDGGIANNVPLDYALASGAQRVFMIQCVCCEGSIRPYTGLINVMARSFSIALDCKYANDLAHFSGQAQIDVVRPQFPLDIGLLDFRYTAQLIEAGYRQSLAYFSQSTSSLGRGNGTPTAAASPHKEGIRALLKGIS